MAIYDLARDCLPEAQQAAMQQALPEDFKSKEMVVRIARLQRGTAVWTSAGLAGPASAVLSTEQRNIVSLLAGVGWRYGT